MGKKDMDEEQLAILQDMLLSDSTRLGRMEELLRLLLAQNIMRECEKIIDEPRPEYPVHIFFNCDKAKSVAAMNIMYNKCAYSDSMKGRRQLMDKIQKEIVKKRIFVKPDDMKMIIHTVLNGNPAEVSKYIRYGAVFTLNLYGW